MTSGSRRIARESVRTRRSLALTSRPHWAVRGRERRERERARNGGDRRGPPVREGQARGRERVREAGPNWLFPFS
jgi:hypothetical protein